MIRHQKKGRYKTERTVHLLLLIIGVVLIGGNIYQLVEAIGKNDDFSIFRRSVYIVVFAGISVIDYFRFRRVNRVIRGRRQESLQ